MSLSQARGSGLPRWWRSRAATTAQAQVTDRIIEEDIRVRDCHYCRARCRRPPVVSQYPCRCHSVSNWCPNRATRRARSLPTQQDEVVLTGMSVSHAFDRLVELDERYVWSEVDGVLVLRPGVTWFDRNHFLHRRIPSFRVNDGRMWAAMDAVHVALGGARGPADEVWPASTPQSDRRFTVSLGDDDRSRCAQCRRASAWIPAVESGILQAAGSLRIRHGTAEYIRRRRHWTPLGHRETMAPGPMPAMSTSG